MFRGVRKWCVVLILLCICKDAFSFEQTPSTEYIPVYYSADDVEILFSQSGELEKAKLQGNVKIAFEDIVMKCDIAQFMKETGDITAEGNLSIETSQGIIKADSIIYNLNNKTGVMPNATFLSPPFYGKAEKIEQKGDVFYFINGYITNCDLEKPHWKISAEQLKYAKGEYFRAEKMRIVFGEKYSVFYFPRYTADMKTKEPVVTARPGSSSKVGENIELLFTQRAGEKTDTVTKERILVGEKGLGAGASITSKTQGYRYEGFLYKDWDEGDIEPALLLEFLKHYTSTYGEGNILLDWRYMDNNDLFYTFFHSDYIAKSKKYNYLSFTQNFKQGIFNINFRDSAEDDFLNIEKLPEIRFYTPP
ncbi:MAG: hypothetical protein PHI44_03370, partial [Candidatus Ratteibacteria bacterium]|nr:hypothetical protein [Candidatus Ratteibacteria bacterium]